jgi:arsenite/tail-anchored protein-transporting ATPase
VDALADPRRTRLVLVARAQRATLREVARTQQELAAIGLTHQHLVINGVLPEARRRRSAGRGDRRARAGGAGELPAVLRELPRDHGAAAALQPGRPDALRAMLAGRGRRAHRGAADAALDCPAGDLVDEIEADGHGLVMVMGKGGVGKTTLAAAIAVELARRGPRCT